MILVHGGVGPEITWERQRPLAARWSLKIVTRRGFGAEPAAGRQDFQVDAEDLSSQLAEGSHLVGFSYGGLGSAVLAGKEPSRVRSLTLIEVPLFALGGDDPEVSRMRSLSDRFVAGRAGDPDSDTDDAFLRMAGVAEGSGLDPAERNRLLTLARDLRPPVEAVPDVEAIRRAGVPVMVVSGDHHPGIERLADLTAEAFDARRERCPGAGHAVPRAPGFNQLLEDFLNSAG